MVNISLHALRSDVQGTIRFTNDTDYWQAHGFQFGFQNVTTFFKMGGEDVLMYGGEQRPLIAGLRPTFDSFQGGLSTATAKPGTIYMQRISSS